MPIGSPRILIQAALLVAYLFCSHFAVTRDQPQLQLLALWLLALGLILRGLLESSPASWGLMLALTLGALGLSALGLLRYVLYLPPVVFPLLLWGVFQGSLRPGHTPLITAIARQVRGTLSPEVCAYTRAVTVLWSGCFLSLAILCVLLSLFARDALWSLFANCLNYVFIALLFVLEFVYRQWRFRELEHKTFPQYLQSIVQVNFRQFR